MYKTLAPGRSLEELIDPLILVRSSATVRCNTVQKLEKLRINISVRNSSTSFDPGRRQRYAYIHGAGAVAR